MMGTQIIKLSICVLRSQRLFTEFKCSSAVNCLKKLSLTASFATKVFTDCTSLIILSHNFPFNYNYYKTGN